MNVPLQHPLGADALVRLLEQRSGQRLGHDRAPQLSAMLAPVLRQWALPDMAALNAQLLLGQDKALADACVEAMLNNETSFFRDRAAFVILQQAGLARLRAARAATRRLRIWSAGCSTGQEAYSLAMQFLEARAQWDGWSIDIVGTDVSRTAIAQAEEGRFSQFEIQRGLPVGHMLRWFDQRGADWIAKPELRAMVRFRQHNLVSDSAAHPFGPGGFDIVLCRNVLIYLDHRRRQTVFDRLDGALVPDGLLMLGAAETVIGQTSCFQPSLSLRGLYEKGARQR